MHARLIPAFGLLLGNAAFLIFYFAYDLTLYQLVIVYWWECLWIGLFSAVKLIVASIAGNPYENRFANVSRGSSLLFSILAIIYLGGTFLALLLGLGLAIFLIPQELGGVDMFEVAREGLEAVFLASLFLIAGHGLSFVVNFVILGEVKEARAGRLIAWPFIRCLSLLAAVAIALVAAIQFPELATTTGFAIVLIGLKVLFDLRLHLSERKAFEQLEIGDGDDRGNDRINSI